MAIMNFDPPAFVVKSRSCFCLLWSKPRTTTALSVDINVQRVT